MKRIKYLCSICFALTLVSSIAGVSVSAEGALNEGVAQETSVTTTLEDGAGKNDLADLFNEGVEKVSEFGNKVSEAGDVVSEFRSDIEYASEVASGVAEDLNGFKDALQGVSSETTTEVTTLSPSELADMAVLGITTTSAPTIETTVATTESSAELSEVTTVTAEAYALDTNVATGSGEGDVPVNADGTVKAPATADGLIHILGAVGLITTGAIFYGIRRKKTVEEAKENNYDEI